MHRHLLSAITLFALAACTAGCAHKQQVRAASPAARGSAGPLTASTARATDTSVSSGSGNSGAAGLPGSVYFDFDSSQLVGTARTDLEKVADKVRHEPGARLRIEGNCDERGTTEYNLALGASRADAARRYLERLGVPAKHIKTVSYGSERPKNPGHDEQAWSENRRDDVVLH